MATRAQSISVRQLTTAVKTAAEAAAKSPNMGGVAKDIHLVIDPRIIGFILRDLDLQKTTAGELQALAASASGSIAKSVPGLGAHGHTPSVVISDKLITAGFVPALEFTTLAE